MKRAAKPVDLTLEREIQRDVIKLYESVGCIVMRTQQSFRRGSMRAPGTPGIPDLHVFPPCIDPRPVNDFPSFRMVRAPFWHETKTRSGKQTKEQRRWQELCRDRGVRVVVGGTEAALEQLRAVGLLSATSQGKL